jgi:predicted aconitase/predicted aconitase with swiveling domain
MMDFDGALLVFSERTTPEDKSVAPLLRTTVPLSFWGGIDPLTGVIVDTTHPLFGSCVSGTIFCLPSGRGSCTASQVLLELILNDKAPRAIVLRDLDGLVCVGAIVAQEIFQANSEISIPDIIYLGTEKYNQLMQQTEDVRYGKITSMGTFIVGKCDEEVARKTPSGIGIIDLLNQVHHLTDEEQSMLESAESDAARMALWVLFRYAHIVTHPHPPTYVDIYSSHIDGCTYIGPGGLELAQLLVKAGGKVKVPTTLNSVSCDRQQWKNLGVPDEYARASLSLGDAYLAMGCKPTFTCAPYLLLGETSLRGQDICWGESNAVVFANSVLGARTEKYADYLDICAALVGKTVKTGVHEEENRRPQIVIDATGVLGEIVLSHSHQPMDSLFPVLGHLCGTLSDGMVPLLLGLESWNVTMDQLKAFCAAFGTTGTSPLIHIAGITPEALDASVVHLCIETIERPTQVITIDDLYDTYSTLDSSNSSESIDLVALGNPHLSVNECKALSELVSGSSKKESVRVMACMSRSLQAAAKDHVARLEEFGVEFIYDTCWCMLLDPPVIPISKDSTILTNSGKYAHYGPGLTQRKYRFGSWHDCVNAAVTGTHRSTHEPPWLSRGRSFATTTLAMLRRTVR